jgi:hypothetical protein
MEPLAMNAVLILFDRSRFTDCKAIAQMRASWSALPRVQSQKDKMLKGIYWTLVLTGLPPNAPQMMDVDDWLTELCSTLFGPYEFARDNMAWPRYVSEFNKETESREFYRRPWRDIPRFITGLLQAFEEDDRAKRLRAMGNMCGTTFVRQSFWDPALLLLPHVTQWLKLTFGSCTGWDKHGNPIISAQLKRKLRKAKLQAPVLIARARDSLCWLDRIDALLMLSNKLVKDDVPDADMRTKLNEVRSQAMAVVRILRECLPDLPVERMRFAARTLISDFSYIER